MVEHIRAKTFHSRRGELKNAFTYGVDYVLTDFLSARPRLMSFNRFNLWSVCDRNHGGERGRGSGIVWFRQELTQRSFPVERAQLVLLTQPSFLGFNFNPVSFWIALIDERPCAFIAEVNNTFGHRHCYFCAREGFLPIEPHHQLTAEKLMHVSPFQKVEGRYTFNFGLSRAAVNIRISYENGAHGVLATLNGPRKPASSAAILASSLRRPFGALRVLTLIHWQAVRLWAKRAPFLKKQPAPGSLISDGQEVLESRK